MGQVRGLGPGLDVVQHHAHRRVRLEGQAARDELVEEDAQRVEVDPPVELEALVAHGLLGRHVLRRPHHHPRLGRDLLARALEPLEDLGQAEVENLDHLFPAGPGDEHEVLRLDVAVEDAEGVGGAQGQAGLARDLDRPAGAHHLFLAEDAAQAAPLHVLHDDEGPAVVRGVEVVDPDDVGMLQLAGQDGFALEPGQELLVGGEVGADDLDGPDLAEGDVLRLVDRTHPARAQPLEDLVLAAQDEAGHELGDRPQLLLVLRAGCEVDGVGGMAAVAVLHFERFSFPRGRPAAVTTRLRPPRLAA